MKKLLCPALILVLVLMFALILTSCGESVKIRTENGDENASGNDGTIPDINTNQKETDASQTAAANKNDAPQSASDSNSRENGGLGGNNQDSPNGGNTAIAANGYTWVVEPTLDYEKISYCEKHGDYHVSIDRTEEDKLLDEKTGKPTGEDHIWYGGANRNIWVYDPKLYLMGYYDEIFEGLVIVPIGDFEQKFPDEVSTVKIAYYIDSTKLIPDVEGKFLREEAFLGDKALVFGKDLICYNHQINTEADTELLQGKEEGAGRRTADFVAVRDINSGKHGIIYKNGDVIVPFALDDILIIDEKTAFAKLGGKYGIIEYNKV